MSMSEVNVVMPKTNHKTAGDASLHPHYGAIDIGIYITRRALLTLDPDIRGTRVTAVFPRDFIAVNVMSAHSACFTVIPQHCYTCRVDRLALCTLHVYVQCSNI